MIRPPHIRGAAFTTSLEGDMRHGPRGAVSHSLGIPDAWAHAHQIHGANVVAVRTAGNAGDADGLITRSEGLPLAAFTADCVGVIIEADSGVGVAHAGWRGAIGGVVTATLAAMGEEGMTAQRAAIGPHIRSCCFEVGPDVAEQFRDDHHRMTSWGTRSVDLAAVIGEQMRDLDTWDADTCTRCGPDLFSHRADGTNDRMAAVTWRT